MTSLLTGQVTTPWICKVGSRLRAYKRSRKRFRDEQGRNIPKKIEEPNTVYVEAQKRPRGPFLHECEVELETALTTIRAVIRAAEAGLYPANGALTGQCGRCPYRGVCVQRGGGAA